MVRNSIKREVNFLSLSSVSRTEYFLLGIARATQTNLLGRRTKELQRVSQNGAGSVVARC